MSDLPEENNEYINPNNLIEQIKRFDKSKLKPINDPQNEDKIDDIELDDMKINDNKTKSTGKKEKVHNIMEQLEELDKFIEEYFPIDKMKTIDYSKKKDNDVVKKKYKCDMCDFETNNGDVYKEHHDKHINENENSACICNKCGDIFENDDAYDKHKFRCKLIKLKKKKITEENNSEDKLEDEKNDNQIQIVNIGKYECPVCHLKFSNSFVLGEHFILDHNDYDTLCSLDVRNHNGFPGFNILEKIMMINFLLDESILDQEYCDICTFDYNLNLNEPRTEQIIDNNRTPLIMNCCQMNICCDCLMNHIIETDSIHCPFCRKDHTRGDWEYIIFIEETNKTNREIWEAWWTNHLEIFD